MSRAMARRLRLTRLGFAPGLASGASGRSIRSTSAPISASIIAPNGPGARPAISITLMPANGPMILPSLIVDRSVAGSGRAPRGAERSGLGQTVEPGAVVTQHLGPHPPPIFANAPPPPRIHPRPDPDP